MKLRKTGLLILLVLAALLGPVAQVNSANAAYPSNCKAAMYADSGVAWCSHGTGEVCVVISCRNMFGFYSTHEGRWVKTNGSTSTARCPFMSATQWAGFNIKY